MKYVVTTIPFIFFYIAVWTAPFTDTFQLAGHFAATGGVAFGQLFAYWICWLSDEDY